MTNRPGLPRIESLTAQEAPGSGETEAVDHAKGILPAVSGKQLGRLGVRSLTGIELHRWEAACCARPRVLATD